MPEAWWLYIIECDGGGLYVGIAKDVEARFRRHAAGQGALYTRINRPLRVLASKGFPDRCSAARAERAMKRLTPGEKWRWARVLAGDLSPFVGH